MKLTYSLERSFTKIKIDNIHIFIQILHFFDIVLRSFRNSAVYHLQSNPSQGQTSQPGNGQGIKELSRPDYYCRWLGCPFFVRLMYSAASHARRAVARYA